MQNQFINIHEVNFQEICHKAAFAFQKHLALLLEKYNTKSVALSQKELYKHFEYPEELEEHWKWYGKTSEDSVAEPHECAEELKLISIDKSKRPYSYSLNDENILITRPYQNSIIGAVDKLKGSVLIEVPTGGGKSVIASKIAKNEIDKDGKVLIVAPKIILLEQLKETFHELDPQIIHGPKDYDRSHSVFISTLQTAHKRELGFEPTMIMIDEVHFGFSGKMIKTLLDDFNGRLIGLSATPYDQNSRPIQGFDTHINEYDLNYMFKHDYLVKPICYAPIKVDLSNITIQAGDYNQVDLDSSFNNYEHITELVENTKELILQQNAALIFCINISHANAVATAFNDAGIPTKSIHSQLTKSEQEKIMKEYRGGKLKMLANPMMLTTGFDDPATDCIVLARATKSQNLYRQMVGRGLRLFKGKTHAKIIDCAGVIDNLGLPTQPQEPNELPLSKRVHQCPKCESTCIYRVKHQYEGFIKKCADCGYYEEVHQQGFECESCGAIGDAHAKYFMKDDALYLQCSECDHETLVSSVSSAQELREIFSEEQIKSIQEKFTLAYIKYLNQKAPIHLPFTPEVSKHIIAFQNYIAQNVPDFLDNSFKHIKDHYRPFNESKNNAPEEYTDDWFSPWEWKTTGRLFSLELEAKLLGTDIQQIKKELEDTQDTFETLKLVEQLYSSKGDKTLSSEEREQLHQQLKNTALENANLMCAKRLKDIYKNNEALSEILKFIPMMESVL